VLDILCPLEKLKVVGECVELGSVEELVEREMRLLDVLCPPVELDDVEVCEELVGTVEELSELEV
jgi:hypothetical protein